MAAVAPGDARLTPAGRPGESQRAELGRIQRAELGEIQRARILASATEVVAELGYGGLTVAEVIARAKISRRTSYEIFEDRDECFLAAFDVALARVADVVLPAYHSERAWQKRVGAALCALLGTLDEQPVLGRLLIVDALAAGPAALTRRAAVIETLVRAVDDGRRAAGRGRDPGPLAAEAVVGAILAVLHARLLDERRRKPLLALSGPLMSTLVLPYLGAAAAARELQRPTPRRVRDSAGNGHACGGPPSNPLHGLDMRLTYRTLRVLSVVGELPQASNRQVADRAGVSDQGQMSKLLTRLEKLGLIENGGRGGADGARLRGEPNRWILTPRGREVVAAIRDQSAPVQG
jgi:AcrR family transcriptional regulator/DNA-binding MarR family transcriptional regulator